MILDLQNAQKLSPNCADERGGAPSQARQELYAQFLSIEMASFHPSLTSAKQVYIPPAPLQGVQKSLP